MHDILVKHGVQVTVVNAHHTKNVPGRKSDVQECQWLLRLHCAFNSCAGGVSGKAIIAAILQGERDPLAQERGHRRGRIEQPVTKRLDN